jgi:hypothetical protein
LGKAAGEPAVTPIPGLGLKISRRDRKNHEKQKKPPIPKDQWLWRISKGRKSIPKE